MMARRWLRAAQAGLLGMSAACALAAPAADGADAHPKAQAAAAVSRPAKAEHKEASHLELERLSQFIRRQQAAKQPAAPKTAADAPAGDAKQVQGTAADKGDVVNAFPSTSWYVPPPPPPPQPPPKPTAPPVPFTFMGRYDDTARSSVVVMLTKGDRVYTVSEGDVIDDTYRVDRITDTAVELMYLPLKTKQLVPAGGA